MSLAIAHRNWIPHPPRWEQVLVRQWKHVSPKVDRSTGIINDYFLRKDGIKATDALLDPTTFGNLKSQ